MFIFIYNTNVDCLILNSNDNYRIADPQQRLISVLSGVIDDKLMLHKATVTISEAKFDL